MFRKFRGKQAESNCLICYCEPFRIDTPKLKIPKKQNSIKSTDLITVRSSFCSLFNISEDNPTFIDVQRLSNCCLSCQAELIEAESISLQIRKLQKDLDKIRFGLGRRLLESHRKIQKLNSSLFKAKGYHLNQVTNSVRDEVTRGLKLSKINRDLPPPASSEPEVLNESDSDLDEPDFAAYVPQFEKVEESLLKDCPPGFTDPQPHSSNRHSQPNNLIIEKVEIEDEGVHGKDWEEDPWKESEVTGEEIEVVGDEIQNELDPMDINDSGSETGDEMMALQDDSEDNSDSESSGDDRKRSDKDDSDWEQGPPAYGSKKRIHIDTTILDLDDISQKELNLKNELWNECLKSRPILILKPVPYRKRHKPISVEEHSIQKFIQKDKEEIRKQRGSRREIKANFVSKIKSLLSLNCPLCYKAFEGFGSGELISVHMKETHSIDYREYLEKERRERSQRVSCPYCSKTLSSQESMKAHVALKHEDNGNDKISCEICNKLIKKVSYAIHLKSQHTTRVVCEHCGQMLKPNAVQDHLRLKHGIGDPLLNCEFPDCTRKFLGTTQLEQHMKAHNGEGFLCDICARSFQSINSLKVHMKKGHEKKTRSRPPKAKVECSYCKKLFGVNLIKRHIKIIHEKEGSYFCDKCGKGFYAEGYLRSHMRSHEKARDHPCNGCNMSFKLKVNLEKHQEMGCSKKLT